MAEVLIAIVTVIMAAGFFLFVWSVAEYCSHKDK